MINNPLNSKENSLNFKKKCYLYNFKLKKPALKINKFIPPSVDRMMAEFTNTKFFSKPLPIVNMSAP